MSTSARQMLSPGEQIAGYLIESYIARGGMAVVYRARDLQLGRWVAVKVMAPELAENEKFRQRFVRESELAASIDHPNILPIYQAGEASGLLYIAMRYVEGQDLGMLLASQGALEPYVALPMFTQVAAALDTAHAHGLVHRDVKPGNILLSKSASLDGVHVYLTDFGLTKRSTSLSGFTTAGHFLGTIQYVAPEQIASKSVDEHADIYAMGCVLYESLTGQPPFQRDDDAAMLWAHINDDPPSAHSLRPDLPPAVDDVLRHAMAKEPADRPESCRGVIAELRAAFRAAGPPPGGAVPLRSPAPPPEREQAPAAERQATATGEVAAGPRPATAPVARPGTERVEPPPAGAPAAAGSGGRPWRLFAAVSALLVAVAVAAGWWLFNGQSRFASFEASDGTFSLERPAAWDAHRGSALHGVCFCPEGMEGLFEGASASAWPVVGSLTQDEAAADGFYIEVSPGNNQFQVTSPEEARARVDGLNDNELSFSGSQHVIIGGGTGFWVEGTMSPVGREQPALRFRYYLVDFPGGSAQIVFFAMPDRFDELRPTFERVAESVRFD